MYVEGDALGTHHQFQRAQTKGNRGYKGKTKGMLRIRRKHEDINGRGIHRGMKQWGWMGGRMREETRKYIQTEREDEGLARASLSVESIGGHWHQ
ncbi:hypothetical protein WN55_08352 [Dufourea novaeangliae]|uniref:Uncharacterized protein n=1 Tax=Dufourea novaeangliae TaxID=178035 RepID=A0A154P8W0_DUFNO|nr:hypothetical protein WN55_08352 [Dufourea novaeangliae]